MCVVRFCRLFSMPFAVLWSAWSVRVAHACRATCSARLVRNSVILISSRFLPPWFWPSPFSFQIFTASFLVWRLWLHFVQVKRVGIREKSLKRQFAIKRYFPPFLPSLSQTPSIRDTLPFYRNTVKAVKYTCVTVLSWALSVNQYCIFSLCLFFQFSFFLNYPLSTPTL